MSLSTFRIERTGELFRYDNKVNTILSGTQPIGKESGILAEDPKYHKSDSPQTMKIILGHACNYSCSYCMQKDIGDPSERPKNIMTKDLIKRIKSHLDVTQLKRIELWGGETFLYWKDIIEIITALDREDLNWVMITNGTPLQMKHVDFFSKLKGNVIIAISHDGPGHTSLRGEEFLHKKVEVIRGLQDINVQLSFNTVVSKTNFDLFAIDKYFQDYIHQHNLRPVQLMFELGRTYETGACATESHVIDGELIGEYRQILKRYLKQHIQEFKQSKRWKEGMLLPSNLFHNGIGVLTFAKSLNKQTPIYRYSNCGTDDPTLITIDINGSLRTCQNTNEDYIYGHIGNMAEARMKNVDYSKDDFCKDCSVIRLCNQSCPIKLPYETFLVNHRIENAHYSEIQLAAFELLFDSEIVRIS